MALDDMRPGLAGSAAKKVEAGDLASAYGNPGAEVLSSMTLMTLLEQACLDAIAQHLDAAAEMCVGSRMEMDHLAPTPEGFTVTARAELMEVAGKKLVFRVEASDGHDTVGRGRHVRYVVDRAHFLEQVAAKAAKGAAS
jgi:predicted thioesterase